MHKEGLVPFPGSRLKNLIYIDFFPQRVGSKENKARIQEHLKMNKSRHFFHSCLSSNTGPFTIPQTFFPPFFSLHDVQPVPTLHRRRGHTSAFMEFTFWLEEKSNKQTQRVRWWYVPGRKTKTRKGNGRCWTRE